MKKVVCGDAFETLKGLKDCSMDMGVTSPPYNKGEKNKGWLVNAVKYDAAKDSVKESDYQKNQVEVLNELYRVMKPGGSFFYNHKTRWEKGIMLHPFEWLKKTKWRIRQEITWDRRIAANIRGWRFWQVDEKIFWLYKPDGDKACEELKSCHALLSSVWRFPPERNNPHPAPFPLLLPVRCIYSIMNENDGIVIDPYNGSGTTCVAAKLLNKDYLGIDLSKEYCDMARSRLKNSNQEIGRFNSEMELHAVKETFSNRKVKGKFTGRFRKVETQNVLS